jgi:transposase
MEVRMARTGRPKAVLVLTDEERETLQRWARRPSSAQSLALRSKIVLGCAAGNTNLAVASELGCNPAKRLKGLADEHRSGVPRKVTDDHVEAVIVKTLTEKPADATHWSTRGPARSLGMSQPTVSRIWKAFGLKPWVEDTFKLSTDPLFVDKVRDIVALYMNPPERAVVICVDEKTAVQALDRTQPVLPLMPRTPERRTHDYVRHGTIDLYAALNLTTGMVTHQLTARHRAVEFKKFLDLIEKTVPAELKVHVVLDNSSTHKTPDIGRWLLRHPRFEFHFTPTSSSWINLVERWFAEITNKWLRRGTHRSVKELAESITQWVGTWNDEPRPYVWHKTADEIFDSLAHYCQRISEVRSCQPTRLPLHFLASAACRSRAIFVPS